MFKFILTTLFFLTFSLLSIAQSQPEQKASTSSATDSIYENPENRSEFPGGEGTWKRYCEKNLNGGVATEKGARAGTYEIVVRFTVSPEGIVSKIKPTTNFGFGMEEEAVRIIRKGPNWKPALQNGRNVWSYREQRIKFTVADN